MSTLGEILFFSVLGIHVWWTQPVGVLEAHQQGRAEPHESLSFAPGMQDTDLLPEGFP